VAAVTAGVPQIADDFAASCKSAALVHVWTTLTLLWTAVLLADGRIRRQLVVFTPWSVSTC
jgi:hypothetical protein